MSTQFKESVLANTAPSTSVRGCGKKIEGELTRRAFRMCCCFDPVHFCSKDAGSKENYFTRKTAGTPSAEAGRPKRALALALQPIRRNQ